MGTKNNPGSFDCHAAADPDEPLFTLLARDPLACYMVRIWAAVRSSDPETAIRTFEVMMAREMPQYTAKPTDFAKVHEAVNCSHAMMQWRIEREQAFSPGSDTPPDPCMEDESAPGACACGNTRETCPYRKVQA